MLLAALFDKVGIIAPIFVADAVPEFEDAADQTIEKIAVVGDDQDRSAVVEQGVLEDLPCLYIQVVCRLIEDQQVRVCQQNFQQR